MSPDLGAARATNPADDGQATVELALSLPFLCLVLLGVAQVTVVVREQLAVGLAAREAARAASVSADAAAGGRAAAAATGLDEAAEVTVVEAGAQVTATVRRVVATDLPLIGPLLPDLTVSASVTMLVEPP